jgi:hypothetical protein
LDPKIRQHAKEQEAKTKFDDKVLGKVNEFLDSVDGEDAVIAAATIKINEKFSTKENSPKRFGSARLNTLPTQSRLALPSAGAQAPQQVNSCLYCGAPSGTFLYCSDEHEMAYAEQIIAKKQTVSRGNNGSKPGNFQ